MSECRTFLNCNMILHLRDHHTLLFPLKLKLANLQCLADKH